MSKFAEIFKKVRAALRAWFHKHPPDTGHENRGEFSQAGQDQSALGDRAKSSGKARHETKANNKVASSGHPEPASATASETQAEAQQSSTDKNELRSTHSTVNPCSKIPDRYSGTDQDATKDSGQDSGKDARLAETKSSAEMPASPSAPDAPPLPDKPSANTPDPPRPPPNPQPAPKKSSTRHPGPAEIGGKRARPKTSAKDKEAVPRQKRPELICRETQNRLWEVFLKAEDDDQIQSITQNHNTLERSSGASEWRIACLDGDLEIKTQDNSLIKALHQDDQPLIFKFAENRQGEGRQVSRITTGHFLIMAPKQWRRHGDAPIEADYCADDRFRAHYFYVEKNGSEQGIGFDQCLLPTGNGFELQGTGLADDAGQGDLFIGEVPSLKVPEHIVWARVGEEKESGWKGKNFQPGETTLAEVLNGKQGRFFVRVYEKESNVSWDSGQFRYLHDLHQILINDQPYEPDRIMPPPPGGYAVADITFRTDGQNLVRPALQAENSGWEITTDGRLKQTTATPENDRLHCIFTEQGAVEVVLCLPRIWWRISQKNTPPLDWHSKPITMTRDEFRSHARNGDAIHLHLPRRFRAIHAGFDEQPERVCKRVNEADCITVACGDFEDARCLEQPYEEARFYIRHEDQEALPIIRIPARPKPAILAFSCHPVQIQKGETALLSWQTCHAQTQNITLHPGPEVVLPVGEITVRPQNTTEYSLTLQLQGQAISKTVRLQVMRPDEPVIAYVKKRGGWHRGKGFSPSELQAVGLDLVHPSTRTIPTDKKRRSTHQCNIDKLRRID